MMMYLMPEACVNGKNFLWEKNKVPQIIKLKAFCASIWSNLRTHVIAN
jgi:hypothetical protein